MPGMLIQFSLTEFSEWRLGGLFHLSLEGPILLENWGSSATLQTQHSDRLNWSYYLYSTQIRSLLDWGLTLFPSLSSVEAEYLYLAFVLWRVASITQHCLFMKSIHAISGSRSPFFLLVAFCCIKYSIIYWCTL